MHFIFTVSHFSSRLKLLLNYRKYNMLAANEVICKSYKCNDANIKMMKVSSTFCSRVSMNLLRNSIFHVY